MGGEKGELNDQQVIDKLKAILQCLENDTDAAKRKQLVEEGNELYKSRKEQLKSPFEKRLDEMRKLAAERMSQTPGLEKKGPPETVIKNIYPATETVKEQTTPVNPKRVENCPNPPLQAASDHLVYTSKLDLKNMREGLLQGPGMDPFVVEFRMGEVIVGCQCTKRNGLQSDCKRWQCGGKNACLKLPLPMCLPSGHGKIKPKEKKVFINTVSSQNPSKENEPLPVKKIETPKKKSLPKVDYINCPPIKPRVTCDKHIKGRYYLRPLQKNEAVQTGLEEYSRLPLVINNGNCLNTLNENNNTPKNKIIQSLKITQPNTELGKKTFLLDKDCPDKADY